MNCNGRDITETFKLPSRQHNVLADPYLVETVGVMVQKDYTFASKKKNLQDTECIQSGRLLKRRTVALLLNYSSSSITFP